MVSPLSTQRQVLPIVFIRIKIVDTEYHLNAQLEYVYIVNRILRDEQQCSKKVFFLQCGQTESHVLARNK